MMVYQSRSLDFAALLREAVETADGPAKLGPELRTLEEEWLKEGETLAAEFWSVGKRDLKLSEKT